MLVSSVTYWCSNSPHNIIFLCIFLSVFPVWARGSLLDMSVDLPKQGQTTNSYWLQDGANPFAREGADSAFAHENVDFVVIGSGITGVSVVHHLVQGMKDERTNKPKIILLEARDFCIFHRLYFHFEAVNRCHL